MPRKSFHIGKAERGGFIVSLIGDIDFGRRPAEPAFACTDIDDALAFIKDELEPEKTPATSQDGTAKGGPNVNGDIFR